MAQYAGTYSCGHEGWVNITGSTKDREWKRERYFRNLCPECEKRRREEEMEQKNKEAADASAEMELPILEGSEKQVAWANTLRLELIDYIEKRLEWFKDRPRVVFQTEKGLIKTSREEVLLALDYGISIHTNAKYWIDTRRDQEENMLSYIEDYRKSQKDSIPEFVVEDIKEEQVRLTVKPENNIKDGIVEIVKLSDDHLGVKYAKDDLFRKIIKKNDAYSWDWNHMCWCRKINEYSGTFDDRAADIGNQLLAEGFTVRFLNDRQLELAVSGQFEPECRRWIKFSNEKDAFIIVWAGRNDTLYHAANKLSGAKWSGGMYVPAKHYKQVEDFAETMDFKMSVLAQEALIKQREEEDSYLTKKIVKVEQSEPMDADRLKKKLEASGTIIEDLIDET